MPPRKCTGADLCVPPALSVMDWRCAFSLTLPPAPLLACLHLQHPGCCLQVAHLYGLSHRLFHLTGDLNAAAERAAASKCPLEAHILLCKWLQCSSDVARLCCLQVPVLYPFGHGLSYSSFDYQKLRVTRTRNSVDPHTLAVQLRVKNTGEGAGLPDVKCVRLACPV